MTGSHALVEAKNLNKTMTFGILLGFFANSGLSEYANVVSNGAEECFLQRKLPDRPMDSTSRTEELNLLVEPYRWDLVPPV